MSVYALDLFCGAGGLTLGLVQAGITVVAGIDIDSKVVDTYNSNFGHSHPGIAKDIREILGSDILSGLPFSPGDLDLIVAAPPSIGSSTKENYSTKNKGDDLITAFARIVEFTRPRCFLLEAGGPKEQKDKFTPFARATEYLGEIGYNMRWEMINAVDYGVPQQRKRLYLYGWREDCVEPVPFPGTPLLRQPDACTVREMIGDLPSPNESNDSLHILPRLSLRNLERIQALTSGETNTPVRRTSSFSDPRKMRRLRWDTPAPTITGWSDPLSLIHPIENRPLTLRERARLQTFPDTFVFHGSRDDIVRMIGRATPPRLAYAIGQSLYEFFAKERRSDQLSGTAALKVQSDEMHIDEAQAKSAVTGWSEPRYQDILKSIAVAGLRLGDDTIRCYHLALKTRGFVILAGASGTGKTWLTKAYACSIDAAYCRIAVAPNWTANEYLLGYLNPITGGYHDTPFSLFLREAVKEERRAHEAGVKSKPYHLVLDEMNLAHVEYYLAEVLSAMEVRARGERATVLLGKEELHLPSNFSIIGTINVDDTTRNLSPKIYDRAQIIILNVKRSDIEAHLGETDYSPLVLSIWDAVHEAFPFAFRVLDEIKVYIQEASQIDTEWGTALDDVLLQKILPQIGGITPAVGKALNQLVAVTENTLPRTHLRAQQMLEDFRNHGIASFF